MHFKWPFTICVVLVINLFISRIYTLSIVVLDFLPPQLTRQISPKNDQFSAHNDIFRVERAFLESKPKFHFLYRLKYSLIKQTRCADPGTRSDFFSWLIFFKNDQFLQITIHFDLYTVLYMVPATSSDFLLRSTEPSFTEG